MIDEVSRLLVRDLETFKRELALFPDDESIWRVVPGVANAAGNLALHLAGNLRDFVGLTLGGIPYTRDRDAEFNRRSGTRAEVGVELDAAIAALTAALSRLTPERLDAPFPKAVGGHTLRTRGFLIHLVSHAAFHLGQAGYLRRAMMADSRTAGTMALTPVALS